MKFDQDLRLNLRYDFGKMNSTLGSVVPLAMFFHSIYEQIFPVLPSFRSGSNPGLAVFLLARVDLVKMSVDNNFDFQRGDDRQPPSGGGSGHRPRYLKNT